MAFGKDQSIAQNVVPFRQRAKQYEHQRQQGRVRKPGVAPYFVSQYKPSVNDVDTVRVIEGHYKVQQVCGRGDQAHIEVTELPFFPYTEHFDGREKKSSICSAGPFAESKAKALPCHGCEIYWAGMETDPATGKRKVGRMSRRELYAFTVLDYGTYHEMEAPDRAGQSRTSSDGKPYTRWVKCEGRGCDGCKSGKPTKQGERRHWSMGWGHYQQLLAADKQIGKSCVGCGGIETISCIAWACPSCGEAHVDMASSTLKQKEIDELAVRPATCACSYEGFLQEIIECKQCAPGGGTAKRATIFDVDMNVSRIEATDGGRQTNLSISRWSTPRPVDPQYKELADPMDLPTFYSATPLDVQAEKFNVPAGGVGKGVVAADVTQTSSVGSQYRP